MKAHNKDKRSNDDSNNNGKGDMTDTNVSYIHEPSEQYKEMRALVRKVNRVERQLERTIKQVNRDQEKQLSLRKKLLSVETDLTDERNSFADNKADGILKYLLETDEKIRDEGQRVASKQYLESIIGETLPQWILQLSNVVQIVKAYGHANELQWRSKAAAMLLECIRFAELSDDSEPSVIRLKKLHLEINAIRSNEVVRILEDVKKKYILGLDNDTLLSAANKKLAEVKEAIATSESVVPNPTKTWSQKLIQNRIRQYHARPPSPTLECVTTMKMNGDFVLNGPIHEVDPNRPKIAGSEYSKISGLVEFKKRSASGDFPGALKLFHKIFRPPRGCPSDYSRYPVTLHSFKVLLCAFKNSKVVDFDQAYKVIDMMTRWEIPPDVTVFNIILQACEYQSRWRRAMEIIDSMKNTHNVDPNHATMKILLNCCRYATDEPGAIYDTLRLKAFPRK
jgi:hypothetical protein